MQLKPDKVTTKSSKKAVRCCGCGKIVAPGSYVRLAHGKLKELHEGSLVFEETKDGGFLHKECFQRSVSMPGEMLKAAKRVA
jgi:hypothetical protein